MSSLGATVGSWVGAIRPKTLIASFVPVLVGTAVARAVGLPLKWEISGLAFLSAALIQIGTNFVNDALDFKMGADTEERVGPKRITASGEAKAHHVMWAAAISFALATLAGIPLVLAGGSAIVGIGLVSILFGYLYTGGPFPLAYVGLGDLFVLVFFGWVAVLGMQVLHAGGTAGITADSWIAGTQIGLLATVLIAINNLRDRITDQKVGKRTMAVRLGARLARVEIALLALVPFALGIHWWGEGRVWAALAPLVSLPLAVGLVRKVFTTEPGPVYNQYLGRAAGLELVFGVLLSLGLFFGS